MAERFRFCVLPPTVPFGSVPFFRPRSDQGSTGTRSDLRTLSQVWRGRPTGLFKFLGGPPIIADVNTDTGLPNPALEAAHAVSCDGNTPTYLRTGAPVCLHMGAKIAGTADELQLVAGHQDMIGYRALNADWLDNN